MKTAMAILVFFSSFAYCVGRTACFLSAPSRSISVESFPEAAPARLPGYPELLSKPHDSTTPPRPRLMQNQQLANNGRPLVFGGNGTPGPKLKTVLFYTSSPAQEGSNIVWVFCEAWGTDDDDYSDHRYVSRIYSLDTRTQRVTTKMMEREGKQFEKWLNNQHVDVTVGIPICSVYQTQDEANRYKQEFINGVKGRQDVVETGFPNSAPLKKPYKK